MDVVRAEHQAAVQDRRQIDRASRARELEPSRRGAAPHDAQPRHTAVRKMLSRTCVHGRPLSMAIGIALIAVEDRPVEDGDPRASWLLRAFS